MLKKSFLFLCTLLINFAADAQPVKRIVVSQDGTGDYRSVQEAFNTVPSNNKKLLEIFIKIR